MLAALKVLQVHLDVHLTLTHPVLWSKLHQLRVHMAAEADHLCLACNSTTSKLLACAEILRPAAGGPMSCVTDLLHCAGDRIIHCLQAHSSIWCSRSAQLLASPTQARPA